MSEEFDFVAESYRLEEQYFWYREGADVLCMIALACAHRQVVPEWAAIEFVRLYRLGRALATSRRGTMCSGRHGVAGYRKGAWTHATGPAAFVAVHDEVARVAKLLGGVVPPINNTLFARVAEKFPFGRSTLAKLYAPFARAIPDWAGKMGPIRVHGLAARVVRDKPRAEIEYDLNNIEQLALYIAIPARSERRCRLQDRHCDQGGRCDGSKAGRPSLCARMVARQPALGRGSAAHS